MKRILILLLFVSSFVYSQNLNMQTGSFTRCSGTLYDSGGSAGNYSAGESYTMTICPATPGTYVQLNFNSWDVEGEPFDFMTIYNGTGTGGTVIGTFGDTSPVIGACTTLTNQIASSHPSGCITITFVSDSSGQYAGWDATISCTSIAGGAAVPPPPLPVNSVCSGANPFCADAGPLNFPNVSGTCVPAAPASTTSPNTCLSSAPRPAWYFLEVDTAGPINLTISQTTGPNGTGTGLDVDYAIWGPFPNAAAACANLTGSCSADHVCTGNVVDCSYNFAAIETAVIPNALVGEVYMVLITNYDGDPGYITMTQTNAGNSGAGSTDCTIVCPTTTGVNPSCGASNGSITISGVNPSTSYTVTYLDDGVPVSVNLTSNASGNIVISGLNAGSYTNIVTNFSGCTTATSNITLSGGIAPVLTSITNNGPICSTGNAVFNLTGTPNATVTYNINGGASQTVVLSALGTATVTISAVVANTTFNAVSIASTGAAISGNGLGATGGTTPANATGAISALGAAATAANCALVNNAANILTITLQHTVPVGTAITVSIARDTNAGVVNISDGTANLAFSAAPNDFLQRVVFTTGATTNTITITRTAGAVWVDGVQYTFTNPGCSVAISNTSTVVVNPIPTATISYATPFCTTVATAQAVTLTGTGAYTGGTYSSTAGLSINAATGAITPSTSTAGTYTVTYTIPASGGCAAVPVTTSVTITGAPTATISYATPFCTTVATAQAVTLTGTGAYTGGTYSSTAGLSINAATGAITPSTSTAGTYTVTYTIPASGGCAAVPVTTSVTITAAPTATISYATPFCRAVATAQAVTLTGTGAYTGGTYSSTAGLSINAATGAITPSTSTAGTYTVTYTIPASGGCAAVPVTTSVTITGAPTATISYATPFCTTVATAQAVTLTGTGAYTGGTYSSTAGLSINTATGAITPSTSTAGTYTVTYTIPASGGCAAVPVTTSVTINPLVAPVINCGTSTTTSVQFTWSAVIGATSYNVSYQVNALPVVNVGSIGNVLNYTVTGLSPGDSVIITLTPIGGAGTCFTFGTQTCTATNCSPPTATISYGIPFCTTVATAQAVTLNGTGAYTGGTYSSTAGLSINAATGAITPSTSTAGIYTVTYTIPALPGCSIVTATTSVTITALPTAAISYGTPFCTDNTVAQGVTLTGTGAYTGGSYASTAGLSINATTGAITPSTSTPGTYTVTYSTLALGGCGVVTATTSVTITALPTAAISYAGSPYCSGVATANVTLTGSGAYTGGSYTSTAGLVINGTTGAVDLNASTPGTYTVTYSTLASAGCGVVTATTSIVINATVVPVTGFSYTTPVCINGSNLLPTTVVGFTTGGTYSSTAGLSINATTGEITLSTSTAGTYTVTYTVPATVCGPVGTSTFSITITAVPTATISYGTPFCSNNAVAQGVALTGTGAYTGGSYASTAGLSINAATGVITPSTSTPGTYTVTYSTLASGGCSVVTATTSVTITALPTAAISYGTPFCTDNTVAQGVTLTGTSAYTGGSYASTAGLSINATTGAITPSTSTPGTYTVTYSTLALGGCGVVTATTSVTITALPTAAISYAGSPYCSGVATASVTLTGTGAYTGGSYASTAGLSINATTGVITPSTSTPGTYTVTYSTLASGGCSVVTATTSVTITALPTATISYSTPFCRAVATAQAVTLTGTGAYTGGTYSSTAGLSINVATGAITPSTSTAGTYTVTYSTLASGGCSVVTATTSVTITALPTAAISYGTPFCTDNATAQGVTLTGTGAYTGGSYASTAGLSINATTGVITPSTSTPGTYTVTYSTLVSGGCSVVTATTSVTITALPTAAISYLGTPFCTNVTSAQGVTLTGTGAFTGGSYASTAGLSINAATGAITPSTSTPGTYTVTYSTLASGGCGVVTATTSVTITALSTATISYVTPFCSDNTAAQNVTLTGTGAYTGGSYTSTAGLSINATTGAITPSTSTPGTYTVTYSILASGGCGVVTATNSVTITALPTATISYNTPFCTSNTAAQAVLLGGSGIYQGGSYASTAGLSINTVTGAITPSTSTPGTYTVTYSTLASGGCSVVTATASVEIVRAPIAGTEILPSREVCDYNVTPIDLFGLIAGEDTGGAWIRISGTGGTFNATAGTFTSAVGATDSVFEYRVLGTGPCSDATVRVTIIINTPPVVNLQDNQFVCLDVNGNTTEPILLTTGYSATQYTFDWLNGTTIVGHDSTFEVEQPGTYTVTVTNIATGCSESDSTIVGSSIAPTKPLLISSAYFSDHAQITVLSPIGPDYEYSLDGGAFQDETVFMNVSGGEHTVVVQNKKGCGRDENDIRIVNYPHYFTPNGDGYHETWNIFDISDQVDAKIHIFDRFGKLIKEIRPSGTGWDGTFNGQPLPSTDYWFVVYYTENQAYKEFRAHFALKR